MREMAGFEADLKQIDELKKMKEHLLRPNMQLPKSFFVKISNRDEARKMQHRHAF